MKVKFLQDREVKDGNQNTPDAEMYKKDQVVDLPQSSAEHWISRGVAVKVEEDKPSMVRVEQPKPMPAPISTKPEEVPGDDNKSSVTGASGTSGASPTVSNVVVKK